MQIDSSNYEHRSEMVLAAQAPEVLAWNSEILFSERRIVIKSHTLEVSINHVDEIFRLHLSYESALPVKVL